jgi:hypothetical protein
MPVTTHVMTMVNKAINMDGQLVMVVRMIIRMIALMIGRLMMFLDGC